LSENFLRENYIRNFDFSKAIRLITDPARPTGDAFLIARDAAGCPFIGLVDMLGVLPLSPTEIAELSRTHPKGIEEAKKALADVLKEQQATSGPCAPMY